MIAEIKTVLCSHRIHSSVFFLVPLDRGVDRLAPACLGPVCGVDDDEGFGGATVAVAVDDTEEGSTTSPASCSDVTTGAGVDVALACFFIGAFFARPLSTACEAASASRRTKTSSPGSGSRLILPNPFDESPAPRVARSPSFVTWRIILPTMIESKLINSCHVISTKPSASPEELGRVAYTGLAPVRIAARSYVRKTAGAHFVANQSANRSVSSTIIS
mmetsp:Transcript_57991/g.141712  ORF Transcript_57991/g.141712 Transcript_57991/m.141712 type:complete len:218 (+) Transcript_57991:110-763(+)